jgi:hypothetical protein
MDQLRELWQKEGFYGEWRKLLKTGYRSGEPYFEFGLQEGKNPNFDYKLILDHEVPIWLCSKDSNFRGEFVITPDNQKANETDIVERTEPKHFKYQIFYVDDSSYEQMKSDANSIYQEYQDEERVCFWSIPNQWFQDLSLIRFITSRIVLSDDYRQFPRSRQDWYWP